MDLRDDLNSSAPRLRRYARALVAGHPGPNAIVDSIVHAALERGLENGAPGRRTDLTIQLYSSINELHREALRAARLDASAAAENRGSFAGAPRAAEKSPGLCSPRDKLSSALAGLKLEEREALLLVVLEGFSYTQAARTLKISRPILLARLSRAREALGGSLSMERPQGTKLRPSHLRLVK